MADEFTCHYCGGRYVKLPDVTNYDSEKARAAHEELCLAKEQHGKRGKAGGTTI